MEDRRSIVTAVGAVAVTATVAVVAAAAVRSRRRSTACSWSSRSVLDVGEERASVGVGVRVGMVSMKVQQDGLNRERRHGHVSGTRFEGHVVSHTLIACVHVAIRCCLTVSRKRVCTAVIGACRTAVHIVVATR